MPADQLAPNALHAACPTCGAAVGEPCRDKKGRPQAAHGKRLKAADPQREHRRQARLKTERERAKVLAETPLFAEEALADAPTPVENYWRTRLGAAQEQAEPRAGFIKDCQVIILKGLAQRVMLPEMYRLACERFGPVGWGGHYPVTKWTDLLTGRVRHVLRWERVSHGWRPFYRKDYTVCCEHGCSRCEQAILTHIEKVEMREVETWPPDGYTPPCTAEEVQVLLAEPPPLPDVDDGGVAALVDQVIARNRKE